MGCEERQTTHGAEVIRYRGADSTGSLWHETAYDTGLQIRGSFGYFRYLTEYAADDTFDLCIKCVRG
jgi:hypothetical protein